MIARIQKSLAEKDKGFTLIELLVVIIIIGILAAIAIPVFMNQRKKAVDSSIKSDLRTVTTNVETYWNDNQEYPTAVTGTDGGDITIGGEVIGQLSNGNSISAYAVSTDAQSFSFTISNPNGTDADGFAYDSATGKQTKN